MHRIFTLSAVLLSAAPVLAQGEPDPTALARGKALLERLEKAQPTASRTTKFSLFMSGKVVGSASLVSAPLSEEGNRGFRLALEESFDAFGMKSSREIEAIYGAALRLERMKESSQREMGKVSKASLELHREGDAFVRTYSRDAETPKVVKSGPQAGPTILTNLAWPLLTPLMDFSKPGKLILPSVGGFREGASPSPVELTISALREFQVRGQAVKGHSIYIEGETVPHLSLAVSPKGVPLMFWQGTPKKPTEPLYVAGTAEQLEADKAPPKRSPEEQAVLAVFEQVLQFMSGKLSETEADKVFDWEALHKAGPKGTQGKQTPAEFRTMMLARAKKRPMPEKLLGTIRSMANVEVQGQQAVITVGGGKAFMTFAKSDKGWRVVKMR